MIELQRYLTHPGQPPANFGWNADSQVSFDHGVQTAQAWLDNANSGVFFCMQRSCMYLVS